LRPQGSDGAITPESLEERASAYTALVEPAAID